MQLAPTLQTGPSHEVRSAIRNILTASSQFASLDSATRKDIAQGLVKISSTAMALANETDAAGADSADYARFKHHSNPIAYAQAAGSDFSGVSAQRVAGTTRQILNAVSFPRFVTELITGVFKSLVETNQQQISSYVELIKNIATTTEGFADANVGVGGARQWLVDRFPGTFVIEGDVSPFGNDEQLTPEERAEAEQEIELRLREGASMPSEAALRVTLGLGPQESVPSGNPESLVPLARAAIARNRQQMLSTMVMLGMQRIVIESGRLHASMRFHIDTHSAAADDRGSTFDITNEAEAKGKAQFGPWGAEAKVKNTIGYVSTQSTQTTEEMNTDLDLNSSVELVFKTDYLPLDRLAGRGQADRIRVNTLNPEAEARIATDERKARRESREKEQTARRQQLNATLHPQAGGSTSAGTAQPRSGSGTAAQPRAGAGGSTSPATPGAGTRTPPPTAGAGTRTPPPSGSGGSGAAQPGSAGAARSPATTPTTTTPRAGSTAGTTRQAAPATTPATTGGGNTSAGNEAARPPPPPAARR